MLCYFSESKYTVQLWKNRISQRIQVLGDALLIKVAVVTFNFTKKNNKIKSYKYTHTFHSPGILDDIYIYPYIHEITTTMYFVQEIQCCKYLI